MLQAALLDCQFLDLFPFSENGFVAPEVDVCREDSSYLLHKCYRLHISFKLYLILKCIRQNWGNYAFNRDFRMNLNTGKNVKNSANKAEICGNFIETVD